MGRSISRHFEHCCISSNAGRWQPVSRSRRTERDISTDVYRRTLSRRNLWTFDDDANLVARSLDMSGQDTDFSVPLIADRSKQWFRRMKTNNGEQWHQTQTDDDSSSSDVAESLSLTRCRCVRHRHASSCVWLFSASSSSISDTATSRSIIQYIIHCYDASFDGLLYRLSTLSTTRTWLNQFSVTRRIVEQLRAARRRRSALPVGVPAVPPA